MSTENVKNKKSVWGVIQRAQELMKQDERHTIGYALYNALWEVDKVTARSLVHTDKDPALNHDNIDRFLAHLSFRFNPTT